MKIEIRTIKEIDGYELRVEATREVDDQFPSNNVLFRESCCYDGGGGIVWNNEIKLGLSSGNIEAERKKLISDVVDRARARIKEFVDRPNFDTETHYI
jgi:hypothetical protein